VCHSRDLFLALSSLQSSSGGAMGFLKGSGADVKKNYKLGKQLGSGNFAVVKIAEKTSANKSADIPQTVAVKIIDKSKVEEMTDITREIEIMQSMDHPNVIKLFEIYDEPKKMNLIMELVTGGELFDRIVAKGSYTEKDAADVIVTLCGALSYLHDKKIVHRDLKPENILLASDAEDAPIKVADFGLARVCGAGDMMKTACGTPGYVAPEILKNKGYDSGAVDMWSVGVILYILLCGFPPFYEEELPALFDQILHARCAQPHVPDPTPASPPRSHSPSPTSPPLPNLPLAVPPSTLDLARVYTAYWHRRHALRTPLSPTTPTRLPSPLCFQVRLPVAVVGQHLAGGQEPRPDVARARPQEAPHCQGHHPARVVPGQGQNRRARRRDEVAQKVQRVAQAQEGGDGCHCGAEDSEGAW